MLTPSAPLCGHSAEKLNLKKHTAVCSVCHSFWDLDSLSTPTTYDGSYAQFRAHDQPAIGKLKVKTMVDWFNQNDLSIKSLTICEVGFGGGYCLSYLHQNSKTAIGIEASDDHLRQAEKLGVPHSNLFLFHKLPDKLSLTIDLWVFQDSFEHLPNPAQFIEWMKQQSSENCGVFLVAPLAGSPSERFLGSLWPHRLPDHLFHWSKTGLYNFFAERGFRFEKEFKPTKYVSLATIFSHLAQKFHFKTLQLRTSLTFKFNIGEIGVLFRRTPSS